MRKIGFSHGVIYRIADKYTASTISGIFEKLGNDAIEVCLHDYSEVEKLSDIANNIKKFSYKSIHLPTNGFIYKNGKQTDDLLGKVEKFYSEVGGSLVLIHPDLVEDWGVFEKYKLNWSIENMDNRKSKYKTLGELEEFFEKNSNWKLVLDLNHCYSNDKTMSLADSMIASLKDKIVQIHLSGYSKLHDPLFQTKQDFIIDYCKELDVPVIIESTFDEVSDVKKEFDYVAGCLG